MCERSEGLAFVHFARAALLGAFFLAVVELFLLPEGSGKSMGFVAFVGGFGATVVGSFLPYVVGALVVWAAVLFAYGALARRWSWARSIAAGTFTLLAAPYSIYIARYTFSGPRVRDLGYQPALVGLSFGLLSLFLFGLSWFFVLRLNSRARGWGAAAGLALLAILGPVANRTVLPNEYEALHTALSLGALVFASFAGLEASRALPWVPKRRSLIAASVVLVVWGFAAQVSLARSASFAWLLEGESSTYRYLGFVLDEGEEEGSGVGTKASAGAESHPEKPQIADPRREALARAHRSQRPPPHIVVFSIDNLQADRVGAYGYTANPSTPNIDRIAREGVIFRRAYTLFPGTRVFMSSMLTGRRLPNFGEHQVPPLYQEESLTRLLKKRGYDIIVKGVFELTAKRDFRPQDYAIDSNLVRATSEQIRKSKTIPHIPYEDRFQKIEEQLKRTQDTKRPAFIWLHWLKPHRFRGKFVGNESFGFGESIDGLYDSSVAEADALIPRLEGLVEKYLGDGREVIWVIMSDHGTGLSRGKKSEQGKTLYEDQVHVPLIIKAPAIRARKVDYLIDSALDMSATLVDLAGVSPPTGFDGVSLVPILEGREDKSSLNDRLIALDLGSFQGAVRGNDKLIKRKRAAALYDLQVDPKERNNLASEKPELLREMNRRMKAELGRARRAYKKGLQSGPKSP